MKEQLIQYVELLFAGTSDCTEIKQEILQNTLDRYDDLISQGKSPEAAYRLAILGIGDIQEILSAVPTGQSTSPAVSPPLSEEKPHTSRRPVVAIAVVLYILCVCPVLLLGDVGNGVLGVVLMFLMIAVATGLLIWNGKGFDFRAESRSPQEEARMDLRRSMKRLIRIGGLAIYFIFSFSTHAWHITWLLLPLTAAVQGLVMACMDLKEATAYEN